MWETCKRVDLRESAQLTALRWEEAKRSSLEQGEVRDYTGPED